MDTLKTEGDAVPITKDSFLMTTSLPDGVIENLIYCSD